MPLKENSTTKADTQAINQGAYFDQEQADKVVRFAEKYIAPQFIKGKFNLLPWQADWLRTLYGWRNKDGSRRFKKALLHVAKKNGKTLLVSIIAAYELFCSEQPSPLVVSASTSRENAGQVFKELQSSIKRNTTLDKMARIVASSKRIFFDKKNGEYRAISVDAGSAEGLNLSACIVDEAHAHRSDKLYRSLEYSTIARPDASLITISTAGNDLNHFYYDLYLKAKRVISGEDLDPNFFATVFEIPENLDIENPKNWHLANPSLGTSFSEGSFKADLDAAKVDTSSWLSFQRYRLNRWTSGSDESWLDVLKWDACKATIAPETLAKAPCWLAVDLSQTVDPTSITAVWHLSDKRYHVQSWAFVAEDGVRRREKSNLPQYRQFMADGFMVMSQGDMIDTNLVKAKVIDLTKRFNVKSVTFDQYSAFVLANEIGAEGITVFRSPQSFRYMSAPMKELNQAVLEQRISHDGNSWLRWCVQNVRTETDSYGNVRPHRERSKDHIDGAVAAIMAFGQAMQATAQQSVRKSVYDDRGVFSLD